MNARPIGIFDSGIGGLTIARAVKDLMPQESLVYFGDTAHLPYGDKAAATIQAHALKICDFLLQKRCKVILIACNAASAAAYDIAQAHVGQQAAVLNVIDPTVAYLSQQFQGQPIGLIGTQQTVHSGIYTNKLQALGIQLHALATPRLAPMIEASFSQGPISQETIHNYLQHPSLQHIKALILGCTHYPVIKAQLQAFYQDRVPVVETTHIVAHALQQYLARHQLLSTSVQAADHFIVSALTPAFAAAMRFFFPQPVRLEQLLA